MVDFLHFFQEHNESHDVRVRSLQQVDHVTISHLAVEAIVPVSVFLEKHNVKCVIKLVVRLLKTPNTLNLKSRI